MGRLIAFICGGVALALYAPHMFLGEKALGEYMQGWHDKIGDAWFQKIFSGYGPGVFAGIALILLAIRGRDSGPRM